MIALPLSLVGAVLYRFRGGWPSIPFKIEQLLFCSIFLPLMWFDGAHTLHIVIAYGLSVLACVKGHGLYMSLGNYREKYLEPEDIDFLVSPFFGKDPRCK